MIHLEGIFLYADSTIELHRFANKIGLSRTWFQPVVFVKNRKPEDNTRPYYEVICPHRANMILAYIEKQIKKLKNS